MDYRDRRCPHCGRTNGLYTKYTYKNVRDCYDFEGNMVGESFDDAQKVGGITFYCQVCDRVVCRDHDQYKRIYGLK